MGFGPLADRWQVRTEVVWDDVGRIAHEQREVAHTRKPRDLLDHLSVVVGGLELLVGQHGQHPDEIGQPDIRRAFQFWILMQKVVDVPALIGDPQVVRDVAHRVQKREEVGDQDFAHAPKRLKCMQVVGD